MEDGAMYLVVDCETNGLPQRHGAGYADIADWPRAVQVAWGLYDGEERLVSSAAHVVRPDGFTIDARSVRFHGITTARAKAEGRPIASVLAELSAAAAESQIVIAHNSEFDGCVLAAEYLRLEQNPPFTPESMVCTMKRSADYCHLSGGPHGKKWPTLEELHFVLFRSRVDRVHDAAVDAAACARCFFELKNRGVIRIEQPRM